MLVAKAFHHIGIRVADRSRALDFYAAFGFELVWEGGPEPVAILRNEAGVELNLILNGVPDPARKNVLMDLPVKHPGYTHLALAVESSAVALAELARLGIVVTEGPVRLGDGVSVFVRDPDGNVLELRSVS